MFITYLQYTCVANTDEIIKLCCITHISHYINWLSEFHCVFIYIYILY